MGDVTAVGMDTVTEKSGHQVAGMAVSVCITPAAPAPLPIPYPTMGTVSEGIIDEPLRTKINGAKIATVGSCVKVCHGNEPGTLKEVVSLNTGGPSFLTLGAPTVLIELGMAGITGSLVQMNKAITVGASGSASGASGTAGPGGGGAGGGGDAGGPSGANAPGGGGGSGGSGTHEGAAPPGSSSSPQEKHTCQDGHPVDVVSGHVVDVATDIELPGLIPLAWKRHYSSARCADREATLGPGWAHGFEQRVHAYARTFVQRDAEGRAISFAKVPIGESTFHRRERRTLHRDGEATFRIEDHATRLVYVFEPAPDAAKRASNAAPESDTNTPESRARLVAIRDAWNNHLTFAYDGDRLAVINDTAGREIRLRWEGARIRRVELFAERRLEQWMEYRYDARGMLALAVNALGAFDTYAYDDRGRMIATAIKSGTTFTYVYNAQGRCVETTGPDGLYGVSFDADVTSQTTRVTSEEPRIYRWNALGLAEREMLPDGTLLEERLYDDDGYTLALTDGSGAGLRYWYDERGNRTAIQDAHDRVTSFQYDARDRLVERWTPDGHVTRYAYEDHGELSQVVFPTGAFYALTYDARGRLIAIATELGAYRAYTYDAAHNVVTETNATTGAVTRYAYDGMGRAVSCTDALGRVTRVAYDRGGRATQIERADGTRVRREYDALGNVTRSVDALGAETRFTYGGMGVVTSMILPGARAWTFRYTTKERLAAARNPNGETYSYTYDDAGRVAKETTFDERTFTYAYNAAGRLHVIVQPDGTGRAFGYDRTGKLVEDATEEGRAGFGYDEYGRLVEAIVEEEGGIRHETRFERDAFGRLVAEIQGDARIAFEVDARGRRTARRMPNGEVTQYRYDANDALSYVDHGGLSFGIDRDVLGREVSRRFGGVDLAREYDVMDRLVAQRATAKTDGAALRELVSRRYQYDARGRVARVDDGRWGETSYAYIDDRLARVGRLAGASEVFDYDVAGALIGRIEALTADDDVETRRMLGKWEVGPGNRLLRTERAKYNYDARGRRTSKVDLTTPPGTEPPVIAYAWDAWDRLRDVTKPDGTRVTYRYDALGRRVTKRIEGVWARDSREVRYLHDGDAVAAEIDPRVGVRTFVHEPGTLVPLAQSERRRGGVAELYAVVTDHLGAPKELVDGHGVAWAARHTAFGAVAEEYGDGRKASSPFKLLGQFADDDVGLAWTRYRVFDAETGRWLSGDPLGLGGGADLFGFDGVPTVDVDPLGLMAEQGRAGVTLANENGVKIVSHGTGDVDRPAHAHVQSEGIADCRIGANGKPIAGQRELTTKERAVVEKHRGEIRKEVNKVGRASARMEEEGNLPGANNTSKKKGNPHG